MGLEEKVEERKTEKQKYIPFNTIEKKKALVNEIVKLREQNGFTQRQVAKKCNRKTSFIAKIESFENPLDIYTLTEMAVAIGAEIMVITPEERKLLLKRREEKNRM